MSKKRFFATLAFARQMITKDKRLKDLVIRAYNLGYTCGWQDKSMEVK